jgi:hypothetical protein
MINDDDARLTAFALDELPEAVRFEIQSELNQSEAYRSEVDAISQAAALLRAELAAELLPALTLAEQLTIRDRVKGRHQYARVLALAASVAVCFFIFAISVPLPMLRGVEYLQVHASMTVAMGLYHAALTPVERDGWALHFPGGLSLRVVPYCFGTFSNVVLLASSLILGNLLLRNPWKRAGFILLVIPLVILRNGFNIFLAGELPIHFGRQMIGSPIRGMLTTTTCLPLSLIALLLALLWLRKSESKPKY